MFIQCTSVKCSSISKCSTYNKSATSLFAQIIRPLLHAFSDSLVQKVVWETHNTARLIQVSRLKSKKVFGSNGNANANEMELQGDRSTMGV